MTIAEDDMKTFIGIDVSLESSAVCVLDEHGQVVKRAQIASEPESLVGLIKGLPWQVEAVGMEAGPLCSGYTPALQKQTLT